MVKKRVKGGERAKRERRGRGRALGRESDSQIGFTDTDLMGVCRRKSVTEEKMNMKVNHI